MTSGIETTDQMAAAVAVAERVTLADIEAAILERFHVTGAQVASLSMQPRPASLPDPLELLSICILVMKNGFTVIGKSAPASPENFNADLGKKFAYEDAIRQLWPLMGFALRNKISGV